MGLVTDKPQIPKRGRLSSRERLKRAEVLGDILPKRDPLAEASSALERVMGVSLDDVDDTEGDEPIEALLEVLTDPENGVNDQSRLDPLAAQNLSQNDDNAYTLNSVNIRRKPGKMGSTRALRVSPRHMVMVLNAFLNPSGSCIEGYETATKIDDSRVELTLKRQMHDPCQREIITIPEAFLVDSYRTV